MQRRWWIVALLFLSTVINYVDRQTLSILARTIQDDLHLSDLDYSNVVQAFLLAYTIAYLIAGRITDWLGTRAAMASFIVWWSVANMLTGLSKSATQLGAFRFLLGLGEPGNYTAAPKAISEWFSAKERSLALGLYTAGATIGATIAPPLIAFLTYHFGWRSCFYMTGAVGLLWVVPWWFTYRSPEEQAGTTRSVADVRGSVSGIDAKDQLSGDAERGIDRRKRLSHFFSGSVSKEGGEWQRWKRLFAERETWLLMLLRMLTDPVWYFYLFWFPKYLNDARHITLSELGKVGWIVYLAADLGSILGGAIVSRRIARGGAPIGTEQRFMTVLACMMPVGLLIPLTGELWLVLTLAGVVAFSHLAWQVTTTTLAVNYFPSNTIATAFGIIAAGSGLGGLLSTNIVGHLVTNYSYRPVFGGMAILHPLALLLLWSIRRDRAAVIQEQVSAAEHSSR